MTTTETDIALAPEAADSANPGAEQHGQAPGASDVPDTSTSPTRLVPVTEAIRYRKRAQSAESQLDGASAQIDQLHQQLSQAQQTIEHLERRQKIDALLADADAIDMDVAGLLTEAAVQAMSNPDIELAVRDLQQNKPYLFHKRSTPTGAMSPAPMIDEPGDATEAAATAAATTGHRHDLLRYLRLRRGNA